MAKNPFEQQQQLQAKPARERANPYAHLYELRDNAFPNLALFTAGVNDPRLNGEIYDDEFRRDEERKFFDLFVQPRAGDAPLPIGFLKLEASAGGRGNGKSAFLNHIMWRVNEQAWEDWPADPSSVELFSLAVHVLPEPKKQKNFFELVQLVFRSLAQRKNRPSDKVLFAGVESDLRAALLMKVLSQDAIGQLASQPAEQMTAALGDEKQFNDLLEKHGVTADQFGNVARSEIAEAGGDTLNVEFLNMLVDVGFSLQRLWNETLARKSPHAWQTRGADWLVNGLMPVLMTAGYRHFYLLLDEFEKIYIYQNSRKRDEFLDSFRQYFYERDSAALRRSYITSLLTLHPSVEQYLKGNWVRAGLEQLAPLSPPQVDRHSILLGASPALKLKHLLTTYLDAYRITEKNKGSLFPFAIDALDPAVEAARFYPRGTLWYAHMILRKAAEEAVVPPISREFVINFVSGASPPADDEDNIFSLPSSDVKLRE